MQAMKNTAGMVRRRSMEFLNKVGGGVKESDEYYVGACEPMLHQEYDSGRSMNSKEYEGQGNQEEAEKKRIQIENERKMLQEEYERRNRQEEYEKREDKKRLMKKKELQE